MSRRARIDKNTNLARCKNENSGAVEKKRQKSVTLAGVAELADAPDLGSGGRPWGFESLHPHEKALRPCAGRRAFAILKDILLERENVDGLFIFDICGIFYHIGYLLLCGA